jgi:hypothetical protein
MSSPPAKAAFAGIRSLRETLHLFRIISMYKAGFLRIRRDVLSGSYHLAFRPREGRFRAVPWWDGNSDLVNFTESK